MSNPPLDLPSGVSVNRGASIKDVSVACCYVNEELEFKKRKLSDDPKRQTGGLSII